MRQQVILFTYLFYLFIYGHEKTPQWRNYGGPGGGAIVVNGGGGHAIAPHLTFDCAPFIAMPSSWSPR